MASTAARELARIADCESVDEIFQSVRNLKPKDTTVTFTFGDGSKLVVIAGVRRASARGETGTEFIILRKYYERTPARVRPAPSHARL